jgi:HD superfamily phosphohydrolase
MKTIRDPLWNTIPLDDTAVRAIDTFAFQRLRHVRQLGLAYLVYPGATHSRFDHALGVYHLARRALALLAERGELDAVPPLDRQLVPYAALLHDIGHYPFSHALEELDAGRVPAHHEDLARGFLGDPALSAVLAEVAPDAADRIALLIRGASDSPLQGLVSGSLDLDKIEYLNRDAMFCGVPYGVVDVDRLLHSLTLVKDPESGRWEVGVLEKGVSALESLLFAKYQMFRNVYWHHTVRAATALYKRLVEDAVDARLVHAGELVGRSDEGLLGLLEARADEAGDAGAPVLDGLRRLRERRLPKRALELPGDAVRGLPVGEWIYSDDGPRAALESRLAAELDLEPRDIFLDYPEKPRMMGLDILLRCHDGAVLRLTEAGRAGLIDLPSVSNELYHTARVFRVFTGERRQIRPEPVLRLLAMPAGELSVRLASPEPLL